MRSAIHLTKLAVMTDTDNTKERAVAYYGDIRFVRTGS